MVVGFFVWKGGGHDYATSQEDENYVYDMNGNRAYDGYVTGPGNQLLEDGTFNLAERTLRPAAIGRKNWLLAGNDRGGRAAAVLFTMIASAKGNGADPCAWLRDVLAQLPVLIAQPAAPQVTDLLPAGAKLTPTPTLPPTARHDR